MSQEPSRPISGSARPRESASGSTCRPQAVATLQDYVATLSDRRPGAFLFPGRKPGTRLSRTAGWRAIKKAFRIAGMKGAPTEIGTYTLRKTFARLIYSALGHDMVRTGYALPCLSFHDNRVSFLSRGGGRRSDSQHLNIFTVLWSPHLPKRGDRFGYPWPESIHSPMRCDHQCPLKNLEFRQCRDGGSLRRKCFG